MGVYEKVAPGIDEIDVVIAGGGTAGCIVAARLAEADPSLSILVIEAGPNNYNDPGILYPAFYRQHLLPNSKATRFHRCNKAEALANREPVVATGCVLGGGSSINAAMYVRAQRTDFDSWQAKGWSTDDLWPYLKKLETYHGRGSLEHHGDNGPVHITDGGYHSAKIQDDFISAMNMMGYPEVNDLQNLEANKAVERCYRYVSSDGKRQDTAHTYLHPRLQDGHHPNLHVLVNAQVLRVLFNDRNRATGVEYVPNSSNDIHTVKARKLVIVSSGACGSPLILERSGVGDPKILERAGIPLVADVPGVGENFQDHQMTFYPYKTNLQPEDTLDRVLNGSVDPMTLIESRDKVLGWNSVDASAKIRPTEAEVKAMGPKFQEAWARDFANNPNKPLMLMFIQSCLLADPSVAPMGQYVTMVNCTAYPYSRGSIHIAGPNVEDPPDFDIGFFTDEHNIDIEAQHWAFKKQREVMRRTRMYRGEVALANPQFSSGSGPDATSIGDPSKGISDIIYTKEDDSIIKNWLREHVETVWHSLGTCKMAPREDLGVVDPELNVYGVQGLKVIDISIPPLQVGANTNNTAMVIGEKGADIVIRELGLGGIGTRG